LAQHLTIFDLDHTLIPIDSDYQWGQYLIHLGLVDKASHQAKNDVFYQQYVDGCLDIHAYLAFQLEPLVKVPMAQIEAWRAQYTQERIAQQVKPAALNLVKHHQERGDFCMIITGTNDFVTRPIADAFGIEHLLGTQLEIVNGFFTGRAIGTPSFREGKIVRLAEFLESRNLSMGDFASTTFYSDSANDIPLLEKVSHPVATNPDKTLTALAQARGWKTLQLFDQLVENVANS
jgi:HAD superfamily hydrolase (TIGR01490 family)